MKKKIAIIGSKGLPANYGGFETLTNYISLYQGKNYDITVFCDKTNKKSNVKTFNGVNLKYLPLDANGIQSIPYDIIAIILSWFKYDSLLILGTPGVIIIPFLKIFKKTNTIINFGGLEWKRDKWNFLGKWFLKKSEAIAIKHATHIVADNQYFVNYIKSEYNKETKLIEYGGDHVKELQATNEIIKEYPFLNKEYFLSVSRAQYDNNLHLLLEAFSKMQDKTLVLISNWNNFEYGKDLKLKYKDFSNIYMVDAIYDLSILDVIRTNCTAYIHSHTYCGTAPSLVEAMNLSLPIISFKNDTNPFTTENKAIFFSDVNELIKVISELNKDDLIKMKSEIKKIADSRYTWDRIGKLYAELF